MHVLRGSPREEAGGPAELAAAGGTGPGEAEPAEAGQAGPVRPRDTAAQALRPWGVTRGVCQLHGSLSHELQLGGK